jgi:hypothetical protein
VDLDYLTILVCSDTQYLNTLLIENHTRNKVEHIETLEYLRIYSKTKQHLSLWLILQTREKFSGAVALISAFASI